MKIDVFTADLNVVGIFVKVFRHIGVFTPVIEYKTESLYFVYIISEWYC